MERAAQCWKHRNGSKQVIYEEIKMPIRKSRPLPILSEREIIRFWSYVDKRGPNECWPWTGASGKHGLHGAFMARVGFLLATHRVAYFLAHGTDPGKFFFATLAIIRPAAIRRTCGLVRFVIMFAMQWPKDFGSPFPRSSAERRTHRRN